jgi:hypothetical protein
MTEYHVVLVDASGDVAGWLSPGCRLVNAAWEAGRFTQAAARDFAGFARRHIRGPGLDGCTWRVVEVSAAQRDHYAGLVEQASGAEA